VLVFRLREGASDGEAIGTEPKAKFYVSLNRPVPKAASAKD